MEFLLAIVATVNNPKQLFGGKQMPNITYLNENIGKLCIELSGYLMSMICRCVYVNL